MDPILPIEERVNAIIHSSGYAGASVFDLGMFSESDYINHIDSPDALWASWRETNPNTLRMWKLIRLVILSAPLIECITSSCPYIRQYRTHYEKTKGNEHA